jgi:hypothetical protein
MFLSLILGLSVASAQEARSTLRLDDQAQRESSKRSYDLDFRMELRTERDQRERPQNRARESVHEISLGGEYRFDRAVGAVIELSFEQLNGESTFFAKRAFVDWTPWAGAVETRLGQQFIPVGLINERDNLFSSNPPFLQRIFAASKGIDLGVVVDIYPLNNRWLFAEGAVFSGRPVREADQRSEAPEKAPRALNLKSHSEFHDAFATYYEHDLAFFDPIKSWGAGFEFRSPEWHRFRASLLSELWRFDQLQKIGPREESRAFLLFGRLQWWRMFTGYRWSESRGQIVSALGRDRLPLESSRLFLFGAQLASMFSIQAERVMETQSQVLRDEWVGRAILNWTL